MTIVYEWLAETIDEYGDVVQHEHAEKLVDIPDFVKDVDGRGARTICLVKDVYDNASPIPTRAWAYVENALLPEYFDDGTRVNPRFHLEYGRAYRQAKSI